MKIENKTKAQLIEELTALRSEFGKMKASCQAFAAEKQKYEAFIENVEDSCFEVDLNGRYVFFNDALCQHSGYSREELLQGVWRQQMGSKEMARETINIYQ